MALLALISWNRVTPKTNWFVSVSLRHPKKPRKVSNTITSAVFFHLTRTDTSAYFVSDEAKKIIALTPGSDTVVERLLVQMPVDALGWPD